MCNKVVDTSPEAQEMIDIIVYIEESASDWHKSQNVCDEVNFEDSFMLKYCPDRCNTQEICNKAVDASLSGLNFVPDWFVTTKLIKKLMIIQSLLMKILVISHFQDLNNVNLDGNNFNKDDARIIIHLILIAW